jgi:SAM-dependent methyltransferase
MPFSFSTFGRQMKPQLAHLLVCPACQLALQLDVVSERAGEIIGGSLQCSKCRRQYPVLGGIPRFVASDAYLSTFSFEWKRWRRTQFDTTSRHTSLATFSKSTGWKPADLAGKLVLDAGCGAGRYMDLAAGADAQVVGVDMSLAVEVAYENLGTMSNCHFVQADLLHLPFPSRTFDFVYSIGVLHHTPSTRESFARLVPVLKPGGEIAIWVYPLRRLTETFRHFPDRVNEVLANDVNFTVPPKWQETVRRLAPTLDWTMETTSRVQRSLTTRLPPRWLYGLCHLAIPLYYICRIPLFYPLRLLTKVAMHPEGEWRVLDTFDWYSPRYQWKQTYAQVQSWFEEAGLVEVQLLPRPVAMRGRKKVEVGSQKSERGIPASDSYQ